MRNDSYAQETDYRGNCLFIEYAGRAVAAHLLNNFRWRAASHSTKIDLAWITG